MAPPSSSSQPPRYLTRMYSESLRLGNIRDTADIEEEFRSLSIVGDHPSLSLSFSPPNDPADAYESDTDEDEPDEYILSRKTTNNSGSGTGRLLSPQISLDRERGRNADILVQLEMEKKVKENIVNEHILRQRLQVLIHRDDPRYDEMQGVSQGRLKLLEDMERVVGDNPYYDDVSTARIIDENMMGRENWDADSMFVEEDTEDMTMVKVDDRKLSIRSEQIRATQVQAPGKKKGWKSFGDASRPSMDSGSGRKRSFLDLRHLSKEKERKSGGGSRPTSWEKKPGGGGSRPTSWEKKKKGSFGDGNRPSLENKKSFASIRRAATNESNDGGRTDKTTRPPIGKQRSFANLRRAMSNESENHPPHPPLEKKKSFLDMVSLRGRKGSFNITPSPSPRVSMEVPEEESKSNMQLVKSTMRKKKSFGNIRSPTQSMEEHRSPSAMSQRSTLARIQETSPIVRDFAEVQPPRRGSFGMIPRKELGLYAVPARPSITKQKSFTNIRSSSPISSPVVRDFADAHPARRRSFGKVHSPKEDSPPVPPLPGRPPIPKTKSFINIRSSTPTPPMSSPPMPPITKNHSFTNLASSPLATVDENVTTTPSPLPPAGIKKKKSFVDFSSLRKRKGSVPDVPSPRPAILEKSKSFGERMTDMNGVECGGADGHIHVLGGIMGMHRSFGDVSRRNSVETDMGSG